MYYRLHTDGFENVYMEKVPRQNSHVPLTLGRQLDVQSDDIELPYRFTMSVDEGEDALMYGWFPGSYLMQDKLIDVLSKCGVDNLQKFPAKIQDARNGENVTGYSVVNIVGLVSCASMENSDSLPVANVHFFKHLVIEREKINSLKLFRVAESPMVVIVHEEVAKCIIDADLLGLTLEKIADEDE